MEKTLKDAARQLIDRLPDDATWEDLQYEMYVRQSIEAGIKDFEEGRVHSSTEVRRRLGIEEE